MKFLMIFVVLFEELFGAINKFINVKQNWYLIPAMALPFLVYYFLAFISITLMQIAFLVVCIVFIVIFLMMLMDGCFEKPLLLTMLSFIFAGTVMVNMVEIQTISEKDNVKITQNKIIYEGITEDTTCEVKNCESKNFNIEHYRKKLFNLEHEAISVTCQEEKEKEKIQEIK